MFEGVCVNICDRLVEDNVPPQSTKRRALWKIAEARYNDTSTRLRLKNLGKRAECITGENTSYMSATRNLTRRQYTNKVDMFHPIKLKPGE